MLGSIDILPESPQGVGGHKRLLRATEFHDHDLKGLWFDVRVCPRTYIPGIELPSLTRALYRKTFSYNTTA